MANKTIQVTADVLGKPQQFTCTLGQEQELYDAVSLLNRRVEEMKNRSTVRNEHNALLMAALHLCHEVNALNKDANNTSSALKTLCEKLSSTK
ncbi:cell division protein ZapA [Pseudoalteromonas xiamenensis]|uniref:cell division protein ZapA n=1 Tax=Pseudoalteromonas xiamenensis TaxID=882626 RepID=UPI0027E4563C|nr:cell division protein ZapA [Pseudoalteromonas xiamenensis]WMN58362.1 cell division protein ZapA [Pseudoalteromonas xiamenensis]